MTVLYIVRHGETTWNRDGRVQGHTDVPLSEVGRQQARDLGERLAQISFHAAYSSDLSRALQTAELIVGATGPRVVEWPDLRERHCGRWEGQFFAEIAERDPAGWQAWIERSPNEAPHGGENQLQLEARVHKALERIVENHPDHTVLVVSHGAAIRALLDRWLQGNTGREPVTNCAAFVVESAGSERRLIGRL